MSDLSHDFGTGLRAHLGLEEAALELAAASEPDPEAAPAAAAVTEVATEEAPESSESAMLETLIAFESELLDRERALAHREATFAGRAGALLAAAKELYDEAVAGKVPSNDELARMRRRKSGAA